MTLEEAIDHLQETLQDKNHAWTCEACKEEHEQLKQWLIELKRRREKEARYKKTEPEDDEVTEALKEIRTWQ